MLFNIEEEDPQISGWLVADNPGAPAFLRVALDGGRSQHLVEAGIYRPDLKEVGVHRTGHGGFFLPELSLPGLTRGCEIEIFDAATNVLIYRRAAGADLPIKLFHLETQTWPVYWHARHLLPHVQMIYSSAEMINEETLRSLMWVDWPSVFVTGAILLKHYESSLHARAFRRAILLSDPARELAGRLIRIKALGADEETRDGWRSLGQDNLIDLFEGADIRDPATLGRIFRRLGDEEFQALASPTVRKLVAKTPDLPLEKHHVGVALDSLAAFDVVSFDDDLDGYVDGLEALLGRDGLPREKLDDPPDLPAVMAAIASCRPAGELLEFDLDLAALVRGALDRARRSELEGT